MPPKETAEQKLLKIIEAQKKAKAGALAQTSAPVAVAKSRNVFAVTFRQINILLIVCMGASFLFFGYEIRTGLSLLKATVEISAGHNAAKDSFNSFVPQMKSISYYLDKIGSRNIFQPYEKKVAAVEAAAKAGFSLEQQMAKYKIVGLSWLDVPESATVMIESIETHMTHFLKEGDKVDDVIVKTIYTDRVVFSRANEEITIKL